GCLDADSLVQSRDTQGDVGTTISTPQEMSRDGLLDVARAGLKRAQEAARTLEEYSKVVARPVDGAAAPGRFAQIRYGLYTLEKAILTAVSIGQRLEGRSLYLLLTRELCQLDWEIVLREAIAGGVGIVQIREKSMADGELLAHSRCVREITRESGTLLIMNDRPDLAVLADCDGVHVGQEELSVRDVRRIAGPDRLVGVSTHSIEQARQAVLDGASCLGIGPVFPSQTKQFEEFAGLDFVSQVADEISLPAFPIGGIDGENLDKVLAAGASRIAVSGAVCRSQNPRQAAADLCGKLARQ
ncbi:MAG: thiamine phosphate synthase, partial [Planctomycetes bacterium]|nr:thiamine phosphate synthase [Planctomycetota bacterium]